MKKYLSIVFQGLNKTLHFLRVKVWPNTLLVLKKAFNFFKPRWKKYLIISIVSVTLFVSVFFLYVYSNYRIDRADIISSLAREKEWLYGRGVSKQKASIKIYDRRRRLLGEYLPERGSHITMQVCKQMKWLPIAVVSAEDRYFFEHHGISWKGIARATVNNIKSMGLREGAGTITQQLARNIFTGRERTFKRKLMESFIASLIEEKLDKQEILCLYLNKIYMGEGRIGAEEASWFYFKKPPQNLTLAESAMIAGLFPSPVRYSPLNNIRLSLKKQKSVLYSMLRDKHIKKSKLLLLQQRFIKRYEVTTGYNASPGRIGQFGASRDFRFNIAPTVNTYVKNYLYENLEESQILQGGLKVFTTIDKTRQIIALQSIRSTVKKLRNELIVKSKKLSAKKAARYARRINGVLVSIDPNTGDILALVGGYSVSGGNMYRRPFQMRRQPGSALKGFLYAIAMDEEILDVNSIVSDKRFRQGKWSPKNWNGKYLGDIPLRKALAISSNSVAVRTLDKLGAGVFRRRMMSAIEEENSSRFPTNLTLALGSAELTPVEVARIYSMINNGGLVVDPAIIVSIQSANGDLLVPPSEELRVGPELLSSEACNKAVKLMTYVFDPEEGGTARHIGKRKQKNENYLPFDIAGKTGTVQVVRAVRKKFPGVAGSQKDAWFVGLVPGETTVVWLGQDEGSPITRGSSSAASTWANYAQSALKGKIQGTFPKVEITDPKPDTEEDENDFFDNLFSNNKTEAQPKKKDDTLDEPQENKNPKG